MCKMSYCLRLTEINNSHSAWLSYLRMCDHYRQFSKADESRILVFKVNVEPLSHQTAMPQRLYSVLKPCQRAVGSPLKHLKISNLSVIACTQRPHSVPTASTRRSHSVFAESMTFSQRASSCCSVYTART